MPNRVAKPLEKPRALGRKPANALDLGNAIMTSRGIYLQWEGKRVYRQRIPTPRILEPVAKLSVDDVDDNLIIEGDSLQAMASLKSRYAGAIDVVYIDPPYNL